MSRRRSTFGLGMLCVLVISAVLAQGAQAVEGITAYTCVQGAGGKELWGEHCLSTNPTHGELQEWGHVAIAQGETTHATTTNEKTSTGTTGSTPLELKATVGGVPVGLQATVVHGTGTLENLVAGLEHYVRIDETITFSGVTVTEPAHCAIEGITAPGGPEMVTTVPLVGTTKEQGGSILIVPETGTTFTEFKIVNSGGTCAAANPAAKIVGSVRAQPDLPGATTFFNETNITTEKTLRFGSAVGPVAGLAGKTTLKAGKEPIGEPTHPISATRVVT